MWLQSPAKKDCCVCQHITAASFSEALVTVCKMLCDHLPRNDLPSNMPCSGLPCNMPCSNPPCNMLCDMTAGAGWGYFILNLFLLLAVADAIVAALAALFTMRSNKWRTAGALYTLPACSIMHCQLCNLLSRPLLSPSKISPAPPNPLPSQPLPCLGCGHEADSQQEDGKQLCSMLYYSAALPFPFFA